MMIHEQQVVLFFFTAKWDQCMQVLLAGTAARVPTSSSDGKRKTKKKKKWNGQVTESSPISCWDDFTEAGQRRPKSQPHCDCRGAPTTHNPLQLFLFFNQWHGWVKKTKIKKMFGTNHARCTSTQCDAWQWGGRKKNKQNKSKSQISSVSLCVF